MNKKLIDATGTILLFIGFFLAFFPHATHIAVGINDETSHLEHIIIGITLAIFSLVILIYNNKALKFRTNKT